jgi:hypothetical protein
MSSFKSYQRSTALVVDGNQLFLHSNIFKDTMKNFVSRVGEGQHQVSSLEPITLSHKKFLNFESKTLINATCPHTN